MQDSYAGQSANPQPNPLEPAPKQEPNPTDESDTAVFRRHVKDILRRDVGKAHSLRFLISEVNSRTNRRFSAGVVAGCMNALTREPGFFKTGRGYYLYAPDSPPVIPAGGDEYALVLERAIGEVMALNKMDIVAASMEQIRERREKGGKLLRGLNELLNSINEGVDEQW